MSRCWLEEARRQQETHETAQTAGSPFRCVGRYADVLLLNADIAALLASVSVAAEPPVPLVPSFVSR